MDRDLMPFAIATLVPALLLVVGAFLGGLWILSAVLWLTALVTILDRIMLVEDAVSEAAGDAVSLAIALSHFALIIIVLWALAGTGLSPIEKCGLFFGAGLWLGQVSNANAHELIHRPHRSLHRLGMWTYITLLFGHHTSAHRLVHHRYVGTQKDPNTARKGESLYRYLLRAWVGSFRAGYRAEKARLAQLGRPAWRNPYVVYVGGAFLCLALATVLGGVTALAAYVTLCLHAQLQLLMSDYVQHYGLTRRVDPNGKPEPVGARHSWNSPHWASSALMLNATRHSDHHMHPAQAYASLQLPDEAPMLPRPLPLMASVALVPPLWRRMMDARVDRWRDA